MNMNKKLITLLLGALMGTGAALYIIFCIAMIAFGVLMIVFCCQDSDREPNRYGPSPKYS